MANSMKTQGRAIFKRSTIAACVMAATAAHVQAQEAASDDPALLEEVVVYGIKQSLQNAQDIKREASTVKDVITASDIGALPDKSVVEALQRVPGVAIERFEASDDPDHFSVEGGNVTVRGLNRVRAEINGRDGFSASGDGGLNFSDIPPQMVGSVEVVKSQSASITEGGIAGTINLITRKPFDKEELILGVTAKASYADLVDDVSPEISAIASNVWDTEAGKFGAQLSVTSSTFTSRGDGVGVFNYKPVVNSEVNPKDYPLYAPLGGSARQQENERDRLGIAGTLQWANPSDTVQATLEFIRSDSTLTWTEHFVEFAAQPFSTDAAPTNLNPILDTYDCDDSLDISFRPCMFTSGLIQGGNGNPWESDPAFRGNPFYVTGARTREDKRVIDDISFNLEYAPNDNLKVVGDFQYVNATNEVYDMTAHGRLNSTDAYLDLRDTDGAKFELVDNGIGTNINDPQSYFMRSAMDFTADNEGEETAFQLDGEYSFDDSIITSVQSGLRVSTRTIDFRESAYNWGSLGETWMGSPTKFDQLLNTGLVEEFTFEDHLDGKSLNLNDTFYFPTTALLANGEEFYRQAADAGVVMSGASWKPLSMRDGVIDGTPYRPNELASVDEDRSAFYVQVNFSNEDGEIAYSGDFGLRYVSWQLSSTGSNVFGPKGEVFSGETNDFLNSFNYTQYYRDREFDWQGQSTTEFFNTQYYDQYVAEATTAGEADPAAFATARINSELDAHFAAKQAAINEVRAYLNEIDGAPYTVKGEEFTRVLPSFNLKLGLNDNFITRFAFSESIFLPTLNNVRNTRVVTPELIIDNFETTDGVDTGRIATVTPNGYVANGGGNPLLQPELATNYDLTFEWYGDELGSVTTSLFYKRIRDYFRQSTVIEPLTNSSGQTEFVAVTSTQNAGVATVQGYEVAVQSDFGWINESLSDFGIQASYTFIDGSSDDYGTTNYGGDPDDKYSLQYTFNNIRDLPLEGLSKDNYNLVVFYDNGTFQTRFAYNWRSKYLLNSRDVIAFAPVYGEATGQLDASMAYQINDNFKVGLEANNLLNEVTKTSIDNELYPEMSLVNQETANSPRSYFVNDRRFAVYVQATF